ncbi:MAG: hypothetical protein ABSF23_02850 [Terracidiphilus sp.]
MGSPFGNPGTNPRVPTGGVSSVGWNPGEGLTGEEARRAAELRRAAQARERQALQLQRENILSQRTSNPNRRAALEAALAHIEAQLQALG